MYGANVKGETVPDCGASEREGSFTESLSVCVGIQSVKLSEDERS